MFQELFPIWSFQAATQFYRLGQSTHTDVGCSMRSASVTGNIQFTNRGVGIFVCKMLFSNLFWLHLLLHLFWRTSQILCLAVLRKISFQIVKMAGKKKKKIQKRFKCECFTYVYVCLVFKKNIRVQRRKTRQKLSFKTALFAWRLWPNQSDSLQGSCFKGS